MDTKRLEGWKAIADYLGRNARTAQRWHYERGMPVHHVPGSRGGAVFANPAEIEGWLAEGGFTKHHFPSLERHGPAYVFPAQADQQAAKRLHRRSMWFRLVPAAGVLLLAGNAAVEWSRAGSPTRRAVPIGAKLDGATLSALDTTGKVLWTFELSEARDAAQTGAQPTLQWALPVDLNADGQSELVAAIHYTQPAGHIAQDVDTYCFATDGGLLWRYRPSRSLTFAGQEFAGPWRAYGAAVWGHSVWVSFIDRTWWPSFVVSLDADGRERLALVNSGHIQALQGVETGGRALMLAGGFNNEFMLAAMAALDASGSPVGSPQTPGTQFTCDNCPSARPWKYLLFPRSDVNLASGRPFVFVSEIGRIGPAGGIEVSVRDVEPASRAVYRLSADLTPQSMAFSDTHWAAHRELSQNGKIGHASEDCPERREGVLVRVWQAAADWKQVRVPPTFASKTPN